jgi:hypothetical protein
MSPHFTHKFCYRPKKFKRTADAILQLKGIGRDVHMADGDDDLRFVPTDFDAEKTKLLFYMEDLIEAAK